MFNSLYLIFSLALVTLSTVKAEEVNPCAFLDTNCSTACNEFLEVDDQYFYYANVQYCYYNMSANLKQSIDDTIKNKQLAEQQKIALQAELDKQLSEYEKTKPSKKRVDQIRKNYSESREKLIRQEEELLAAYYKLLGGIYSYKLIEFKADGKKEEEKLLRKEYPNRSAVFIESRIDSKKISSNATRKAENYIIKHDLTNKTSIDNWFGLLLDKKTSDLYKFPVFGTSAQEVAVWYDEKHTNTDVVSLINKAINFYSADIEKYSKELLYPSDIEQLVFYDPNTKSVMQIPNVRKLPKMDEAIKKLNEEIEKYKKIKEKFVKQALISYQAEVYINNIPVTVSTEEAQNKQNLYEKLSLKDQEFLNKIDNEILPNINTKLEKLDSDRKTVYSELNRICGKEQTDKIKKQTLKLREQKPVSIDKQIEKDEIPGYYGALITKSRMFFKPETLYNNI